ncbi:MULTISPECIES: acyl carrier protein [unclassified Lysinibacillus]|jgi:acyl carrier protein|uniref:acyl carrier protein n=1 Tax=unclassified Lysinibacillus TaxID=2636778 RepID=UPI0038292170
MNITDYILSALQEKHTIEDMTDLNNLNYVQEGYIDSFGIIQFVCDIEEHFDITFSDEEMMSDEFQVVGKLINLIEQKINTK